MTHEHIRELKTRLTEIGGDYDCLLAKLRTCRNDTLEEAAKAGFNAATKDAVAVAAAIRALKEPANE
jgi:hypothetical protein